MKKINLSIITLSCLLVFMYSCKTESTSPPYTIDKSIIEDSAMVVCAHPEASRVGIEILKKGGNAVDAAIATQFALAVVYPGAGNLGGGGFMIFRDQDGNVKSLDYREKAPSSATRNMYLDEDSNAIAELSRYGHLAVGVPGTVAGLIESHQYGLLPFKDLINPAIELAEKGYYLTEKEAKKFNGKKEDFIKNNNHIPTFVNEAEDWKEGDLFVQKDLAETLKRIRDNGKAGFYEGKTADLFVEEMKRSNGIITHEDLKNYDAVWRTPISFTYKGYKVHSMPPPSSGGLCLAELLGMVEPYPLSEYGFHSTEAVHVMVEAERRAYADRAEHLGDSDFYPVPINELMSKELHQLRMADFNPEKASSSDDIKAADVKMAPESEETTHLSVVDRFGNAVSVTTTLNSSFGSKVVVEGAGFVLNNEMDDFSAKPGEPNQFGLIGKEANAIQPGKRMLSSMTPTIVEKGGDLFMVVGTPGGSTIITSVFQVFLNVVEFDMTMTEAVDASRFHHQWLPEIVYIEKGALEEPVINALTEMGDSIVERGAIGRVDGILVRSDGRFEGAADRRGDDDAEGF